MLKLRMVVFSTETQITSATMLQMATIFKVKKQRYVPAVVLTAYNVSKIMEIATRVKQGIMLMQMVVPAAAQLYQVVLPATMQLFV